MTVGVEGKALQACREVMEWWKREASARWYSLSDASVVRHADALEVMTAPTFVDRARQALIAAGEIEG